MFRLPSLALVVVAILPSHAMHADEPSAAERAKIEHLIKFVGDMRDAVFVRNGKAYDASAAAKFIRGKWDANTKEIKTARDFIQKAASVSTTSGKPYLIRFKDGKEIPSGTFLADELKHFEEGTP
jgi:hypothetical protein